MTLERINAMRRLLLVAATPLTTALACIGLYAVLSCPAVERFAWGWYALTALPLLTLLATGGILYSVAVKHDLLGVLLLAAAWSLMVLWTNIAYGSSVF